ncbi:hypothetical protein MKK88_00310 [Methylobacterium sp. E-005]|uniref:hypothetical protein n=1 Tax=Methylobacterium sp. E-005 TaxID=2836549 RepID=UPI001FBB8471|nr:hypothetical protein [Methylobacterium sp. E-005]MCJ2084438.1 hypothetical protein [Methylobacterium sp. E-005]
MVQHTPGPWAVDPEFEGDVQAERATIEIASAWDNSAPRIRKQGRHAPSEDECVANARLIAAAPDMLSALRCVVAAMDDNDMCALRRADACDVEASALRDLILAAEGRS